MSDAPSPQHVAIAWSSWMPLRAAWRSGGAPTLPGLYRIRRVGRNDLDYLGQTGMGTMTLRKRLGMLRGIYAEQMPYRAPHTAGPALWALRHATGHDFEASVAPIEGDTPWRKAVECVAIALYRQEHRRSPTASFGRIPAGYKMSSTNDKRVLTMGRRERGGPTTASDPGHLPGLPPPGSLDGPSTGRGWHGLAWSPWRPAEALIPSGQGLYRLRAKGSTALLYVGQGAVGDRITTHLDKRLGTPVAQGIVLRDAGPLEASWCLHDAWHPHQRLEIENDLVAAHVLEHGFQPAAQFIG